MPSTPLGIGDKIVSSEDGPALLDRLVESRRNIKKKKKTKGVPIVAQWLTNPTRNHEVVASIPGLA